MLRPSLTSLRESGLLGSILSTGIREGSGVERLEQWGPGVRTPGFDSWLCCSLLVICKLTPIPCPRVCPSPSQTSRDICCVIFAIFNVIWATLFLEEWKQRGAEFAYKWGTLDTPAESIEEPRPQFRVSDGGGQPRGA